MAPRSDALRTNPPIASMAAIRSGNYLHRFHAGDTDNADRERRRSKHAQYPGLLSARYIFPSSARNGRNKLDFWYRRSIVMQTRENTRRYRVENDKSCKSASVSSYTFVPVNPRALGRRWVVRFSAAISLGVPRGQTVRGIIATHAFTAFLFSPPVVVVTTPDMHLTPSIARNPLW